MKRIAAATALLLVGCGGAGPGGYDMRLVDQFGPASQEQVDGLVLMMDVFGAEPGWALPGVEWVTGEKLTCDGWDKQGVNRKGFLVNGECSFGATWRGLGIVQLANDSRLYSELSFAHEMCHWVHHDQEHVGKCQDPGPAIAEATAALRAMGR